MSAVNIAPPDDRTSRRRVSAEAARSERRFWIGLGCAFLLHALIILGTLASAPSKRLGEEKGAPEGVSVVIVDLADLESRSSVPSEAPTPPAPPAEAPRPPTPPTPPPQVKTPPQPPTPKQEAAPQQPAAPKFETTLPLDLPGERKQPEQKQQKQAMQSQPTPRPQPQQPQRPAQPSFDMPDISLAPGRMQTAATRPPGITRSGENDEFGRNVIRALARVMPRLNIMGRVTVHILLNDRGNLAEVKVLRPSEDPYLDQNVVFSVKQANFPIPPDASTTLDRTFIVTYIYR